MIHALAGIDNQIENVSDSDDTRFMTKALKSENHLKDIGHAGTSMRFLTAYYSSREGYVQLTGSERMKERPIGPLVDALRLAGANIRYLGKEGFPPLEITGRELPGGEISINSSISSQFISALLMIAPYMKLGLKLNLTGESVSSSYISMTLQLMSQYGVEYFWEENVITVLPGSYVSGKYRVESDWSAASYWFSMALLEDSSHIKISFLKNDSIQGDSALTKIFHSLGINTDFSEETATLSKLVNIHPGLFSYDFTNSPDIVQSMAVALCLEGIPFKFSGTQTLRIKETDRIFALQKELKKLGYLLDSDLQGSFLSWNGKMRERISHPVIETYHDHRMAMAFAPAALVLNEIIIDDPMVVTKSYPGFWNDLRNAGFIIDEL